MRVGVVMRSSRFQDLSRAGIFTQGDLDRSQATEAEDLQFCFADPLVPNSAAEHYDVLLHKISDFMYDQRAFELAKGYISAFASKTSPGHVIEAIINAEKVFDRSFLAIQLSDIRYLASSGAMLMSLHAIEVEVAQDAQTVSDRAAAAGIRLPCIMKDVTACGTAESHRMALVYTWDQVAERAARPSILQSFVNHGGCLHKVYVLDQMVHCLRKSSIPDQSCHPVPGAPKPAAIDFDSLSSMSAWSSTHTDSSIEEQDLMIVDQELILLAASGLRDRLKLSLFGFDVIMDARGTHYIIDVNYFPSFKGLPDANLALCNLIRSRVSAKSPGVASA